MCFSRAQGCDLQRESEDLVWSLDFQTVSWSISPAHGFWPALCLLPTSWGPLLCFSSAAQSRGERGLGRLIPQEPETLRGSNC